MKNTPHNQYKVSAIISLYNSEVYIEGCLRDLLAQTIYTKDELEIIVIDSASPQNEGDIVKQYAKKHRHIVYLRTHERETLYAAWNRGIRMARGIYVTNANTDDRHHPEALGKLAATLDANPDFMLAYAHCKVSVTPNATWSECSGDEVYRYPFFFPPLCLLHYMFGPQPLWRKEIHARIGEFDPTLFAVGDLDFNIRFCLAGLKAVLVPEVLGLFLKSAASITSSFPRQAQEKAMIMRKWRHPENVLKLFEATGQHATSPMDQASLLNDFAINAMSFTTPWNKHDSSPTLALDCMAYALTLAPEQTVIQKNLGIMKSIMTKSTQRKHVLQRLRPQIGTPSGHVNTGGMEKRQQQRDKSDKKYIISFFADKTDHFHFIKPWLNHFSDHGHTVQIITSKDIKHKGLHYFLTRCDIAWFEWGDGYIVEASQLPKSCKIVCRVHRYEVYQPRMAQVNWNNVDNAIFVNARFIDEYKFVSGIDLQKATNTIEIPNPLLPSEIFHDRVPGFNIAHISRFHADKNPLFALQILASLAQHDNRYKLYMIGGIQDVQLYRSCFDFVAKNNIQENFIYEGIKDDVENWLLDKSYILSTSMVESQGMAVLEAMRQGIKPIIYSGFGMERTFAPEHMFMLPEEATNMVFSKKYDSWSYRKEALARFDAQGILRGIDQITRDLFADTPRRASEIEMNAGHTARHLPSSSKLSLHNAQANLRNRLDEKGWGHRLERYSQVLERVEQKSELDSPAKVHNRVLNTPSNKIKDDQLNPLIKKNTFVSICIPTYNREKYIRETIQSALDQNYDHSEIIIVDDGSTDNTEIIVKSFISNKIKYFKKHHTNSPDTRNRCLSEAKGEFILWLDSDDILAPNLILRFLGILSDYPDIDVCYGDIQPFGDLGSFSRKIITYEDYYKKNAHLLSGLVLGNKIPNPGTFIRKDLFSKIGMYNTDFRRAHDYEFWIRCAPVATFKHIGITSLFWRWHETNMSAENKAYDTSFESRLLAKMIQDNSLQTLFPTLKWSKQDTATLIARSELARMFIHWKDFESATSQLELGLKSILPDLASPKTEMNKLKFFEQTYHDLFQSTQNDYFQKIGNIIGRTKISKKNIVCNIPRKINIFDTTNPIISVIIPTYNRPEQLLTAVQSVRDQSFTAIEIIVINDCGVDVSKILKKLNDHRIIYIQHDNNKGIAAARNTGIRASKGIYIAYLDDDDFYFPNHLQTLNTTLFNTQYKIAYTDSYRAYKFLDNGKLITIKRDCPYSIDFDKDVLLVKNIIPTNCIMHEKSCLERVGLFDETLSSHEDWDLWIRLSREFNFFHLKEVTCEFSWRVDGSTMTSSGEEDYLQTRKIIYQRYEKYAINNTQVIEQQNKMLKKISKRQPLNVLTDKFFSKASIIIPTWNNAQLTKQCLQSIKENTNYPNFEIIIIDNGSKDGTEQLLSNFNSDIVIIKNTENLGFAKACNQGAMAAKGQYLVFLNNDTIPQKGWLTELISFMNLHPEGGIAGSKLLYPDDTIQHCGAAMRFDGKFFRHPYKYLHRNHPLVNQPRELDAVTAACFITPRELFFKLGKFDEHYLNGCEDMDYCTAVRRSGATIHYVPTSELYHLESQTPRPEDKDRENFQRYLNKWGKGAMQNEVEIYAKDGFWLQNGEDYSPSPDAVTMLKDLGLSFNPSCPTPADTFQKIVKRIFPSEHWSKAD